MACDSVRSVPMADTAYHPEVEKRLSAALEGDSRRCVPATANMATTAAICFSARAVILLLDVGTPCNKRGPGAVALRSPRQPHSRNSGASEHCIAVHPSDMCVALLRCGDGTRERHRRRREIASAISPLPEIGLTRNFLNRARSSHRIVCRKKVSPGITLSQLRDRTSYAFALVSVAAALEMDAARSGMRVSRLAESPTSRGAIRMLRLLAAQHPPRITFAVLPKHTCATQRLSAQRFTMELRETRENRFAHSTRP